jgi:large subunit ribosomal protein L1
MGKTKTAFVSDIGSEEAKSSEQAYREKKEKQKAKEAGKPEKVHIAGLKGGQRIKTIEAEPLEVETGTETEKETEEEAKKPKKIKVRGKKYKDAKAKVAVGLTYPVEKAIKLVKETSYSKFPGSVELHLVVKKVGTSANLTLPHSAGKEKKIEVASDETVKKLKEGKIDFDVLLATADMMPKLVAFARLLGPKGLMPNPKNGTIIKTEKDTTKFSGNSVSLRTEKDAPLIHTVVGKITQDDKELAENADAILTALGGSKQIVKAYLKATMGPSVKISFS